MYAALMFAVYHVFSRWLPFLVVDGPWFYVYLGRPLWLAWTLLAVCLCTHVILVLEVCPLPVTEGEQRDESGVLNGFGCWVAPTYSPASRTDDIVVGDDSAATVSQRAHSCLPHGTVPCEKEDRCSYPLSAPFNARSSRSHNRGCSVCGFVASWPLCWGRG